jgi:hypothetical protein
VRIVAHDEDSMTNLFFSEVHRHGKVSDFLGLIAWRSHSSMPFDVAAAELHQQVNFSEFGRPDVIIFVTDTQGQEHVVIVEVKLGTYLDSSIATVTGKFDSLNNSRLNKQLALKYRAMISLPSIRSEGFITERAHADDSPYSDDQVRRCKKRSTISLFRERSDGHGPFYLVTLTADNASPTDERRLATSDPCFPLFFDQRAEVQREFPNLGSILWSQCQRLFDDVDSHAADSFELHFATVADTDEAQESAGAPTQDELFVRGRQIVRFAGKTCHLACQGYSFTVRHFRDGQFVPIYQGRSDREKYLGLRGQIEVLGKAPRHPLADTAFWAAYFSSVG